jgi:hypothetical protein
MIGKIIREQDDHTARILASINFATDLGSLYERFVPHKFRISNPCHTVTMRNIKSEQLPIPDDALTAKLGGAFLLMAIDRT